MSAYLRDAQRAYAVAARAMRDARADRDAAVRRELADKVPHREIMAETGLSRGRVDQIRRDTR